MSSFTRKEYGVEEKPPKGELSNGQTPGKETIPREKRTRIITRVEKSREKTSPKTANRNLVAGGKI